MNIALGFDQEGANLAGKVRDFLEQEGHHVDRLSGKESKDFSEVAMVTIPVFKKGGYDFCILVGKTGQEMAMAANRFHRIRCAIPWDCEGARHAREELNANVLALGSSLTYTESLGDIVLTFITTDFKRENINLVNRLMDLEIDTRLTMC